MKSDYFKNKKILVTGGTGFIGSALVRALVQAGAIVRSLDNNSRGAERRLTDLQDQIELVEGDIRDLSVVQKAVKGMDMVCHLAYVNGTEYFYSKPELILEIAVKGMMNVLDACIEEKVEDLTLVSSSEVYHLPDQIPTDETVPLKVPDVYNPRFSYGGGKIISELLLANYGRKFFKRALIIRPHNVYGPDMSKEHVVPQFALRMEEEIKKQNKEVIDFSIQGSGEETRAFIYINDFTEGFLTILEKGENLNTYHIGSDTETSIKTLAEKVAACFKKEINIITSELLAGSTPRRCPDISKLKSLGFKPKTSLEEGLQKTVDWYTQNA